MNLDNQIQIAMEKMRGSVGDELPQKLTEWVSGLATEDYLYIIQKLLDEKAIEQVPGATDRYRLSSKGREIVNSKEDSSGWRSYLSHKREKKILKIQLTRSVISTNRLTIGVLVLTFFITIVSAIFSWKSYQVSQETLNFEKEKYRHQLQIDTLQPLVTPQRMDTTKKGRTD